MTFEEMMNSINDGVDVSDATKAVNDVTDDGAFELTDDGVKGVSTTTENPVSTSDVTTVVTKSEDTVVTEKSEVVTNATPVVSEDTKGKKFESNRELVHSMSSDEQIKTACEKLDKEISQIGSDPSMLRIANFLKSYSEDKEVTANFRNEEVLLAEVVSYNFKDLKGCKDFIFKNAKEFASNGKGGTSNCVMIEDEVVFNWAIEYYEVDDEKEVCDRKSRMSNISTKKSTNGVSKSAKARNSKKSEKVAASSSTVPVATVSPKKDDQLSIFDV